MSINLYKKKTINNQPVLEELLSKSTDTVDNKPLVYDSTTDNVKSADDLNVNTVTANCFCGKATCADIADVACTVCVNGTTGPLPILTVDSDGKVHNTGDFTLAGRCCIITPILQTSYIFPTPDCNTIELYNGIGNDDSTGYDKLVHLCYTPYRCLYDQYDCTYQSRICFENILGGTNGTSINGTFSSDCDCTYSYFSLNKNVTCYHRSDPVNKICSTMLTSCAGHIFLDTCKWNYGENIDGQGCLCLGICSNILYSKSCINGQYNRLVQDCAGTCICSYRNSSTYCPTTLQVCFNGIKTNAKNNIAESYLSEKPNSFILHTCDTTNCKTGSIEVDSDGGYILHCTCNGNCGRVGFSQNGVTFIQNSVSSTIIGDQFSGNAATATNADNSTRFNNCTYSEACTDIRNGLATQACADAIQNCAEFIQSCVTSIESKIPAQASASNQLADKDFVNSSITTNTANFRGTYACVADLPSTGNTNNDYAFVCSLNTTTGNYIYDRYKWVASDSCWVCEYELNTTGFTAEQLASINSGITDTLVAKITDVYDNSVTVCMNGECKGSFSLNQNTDSTINLGCDICNATCFNNCTYACAKEDIRSGLLTDIAINVDCGMTNVCTLHNNSTLTLSENAFNENAKIDCDTEYPGACCTGTSNYVVTTMVCCAKTVCRNQATTGTCHLAMFANNTAVADASMNVSSGCPLTYQPATGVLATCCVSSPNIQGWKLNQSVTVSSAAECYYLLWERTAAAVSYSGPIRIKGNFGYFGTTEKALFDVSVDFRNGTPTMRGTVGVGGPSAVRIIPTWDSSTNTARIYFRQSDVQSYSGIWFDISCAGNVPSTYTGYASMSGIPNDTWSCLAGKTFIGLASSNAEYPLVFSTCCATTAAGNRTLYNDSANNLMYNPSTNTLTACCVRGSTCVIAGNPTACTSTQVGGGGATLGGGLELYHATPFIDFHTNNACDDYSHRIIANNGYLRVTATNATGCRDATQTANFDFLSDGRFNAGTVSVSNTSYKFNAIKGDNSGRPVIFLLTDITCAVCCSTVSASIIGKACRNRCGSGQILTNGSIEFDIRMPYGSTGVENATASVHLRCGSGIAPVVTTKSNGCVYAGFLVYGSAQAVTFDMIGSSGVICQVYADANNVYKDASGCTFTIAKTGSLAEISSCVSNATCANTVRRNQAATGTWHLALFPSNTACDSSSVHASSACPITYNPSTGVLTAKCFCGSVTATGQIDCSVAIKRYQATSGECHIALFNGTTAIDDACAYVSSSCPLTFNPATGVLTACTFCGVLCGEAETTEFTCINDVNAGSQDILMTSATGSLGIVNASTGTNACPLKYNPATGVLTACSFIVCSNESLAVVSKGETALGKGATAVHSDVYEGSTAIGYETIAQCASVAIGGYAQAKAVDGIAIGNGACSCCYSGIAIGGGADAFASSGVALGGGSRAACSCAIAIGNTACACNNSAIAIGYYACADGYNSIAIGCKAMACGNDRLAIGNNTCTPTYGTACVNSNIKKGVLREITVTWCDNTLKCDVWKAIACNIDLRKNGKGTALTSGCTYLSATGYIGNNRIPIYACNYNYNSTSATMSSIVIRANDGSNILTISSTCTAVASDGDGGGFLTVTGWAK